MWWIAVLPLVLFVFIDLHYFIWTILTAVRSRFHSLIGGKDVDLFSTVISSAICVTTDIDFMGHMNNARYLRNADFNRLELWTKTGVWMATKKLGGSITLGGSSIRYRRSIQLFDRYNIEAKILCWDEKAFYLEQRYVRVRDGFICAIALLKQSFIGVAPAKVVTKVTGQDMPSPDFPPEVKAWIESNAISSQQLRKDL